MLSGQGHVPLSQLGGGSGTEQLSYGPFYQNCISKDVETTAWVNTNVYVVRIF